MTVVTHEVRNSLIDPARNFRTNSEGLQWQAGGETSAKNFSEIVTLHLISYPGYGGQPLQCTLIDRAGKKIKIRSHHYVSLGNFEDRTATYGPLIRELIAGLEATGDQVHFYRGSNMMRAVWSVLFWLSVLVLIGCGFTLIGGAGLSFGAIAPMTVVAVFLPVCWAMIGRSKAGVFDPKAPPPELLGESKSI